MLLDPRRLANNLIRKLGAVEEEGSKHTKYQVYYEDQLIGLTLISRGSQDIEDGLASIMAKQLCISNRVLRGIHDCPCGWEEYLADYDPNRSPKIRFRRPPWK